jgi:type I restriction enzyme M protein
MGSVKTQDIPVHLRTWWKSFQKAVYRHDYSTVFHDFVTMALTQFCHKDDGGGIFDEWHSDAMKKYSRHEKDAFNEMFFEVLNMFRDAVETQGKPYLDLFGHMYETLASQSKKSASGQFFTPETVVEMLVDIQTDGLQTGKGKRIIDPTCGSGRMLFIAHVKAPGNYTYGIDIDQLCCKMSAINMMLHGCVGEVVCGNGLWLDHDWRWGLSINPILNSTGIPSIAYLEKEHSYVFRQYTDRDEPKPIEDKTKKAAVLRTDKGSQLAIFDS